MTYIQEEPAADPEEGGTKPETEIIAYATAVTTSTFTPTTNHTPAAGATAVADTPMHSETKQGAKCCGCCCDYRRAVIIVNLIFIILYITNVILYTDGNQALWRLDLDDDGLLDVVEDTYRQLAILNGVGLFASIVAIVGACRYNVYMVGFNILYIIASFITSIVLTNEAFNTLEEDYNGDDDISFPIVNFAIQGVYILFLVIYPHVGFMSEVKSGILSEETYPREAFSCFCTPNRRA
jgi:hypothetical protein